jgi:hypothetical protein
LEKHKVLRCNRLTRLGEATTIPFALGLNPHAKGLQDRPDIMRYPMHEVTQKHKMAKRPFYASSHTQKS